MSGLQIKKVLGERNAARVCSDKSFRRGNWEPGYKFVTGDSNAFAILI